MTQSATLAAENAECQAVWGVTLDEVSRRLCWLLHCNVARLHLALCWHAADSGGLVYRPPAAACCVLTAGMAARAAASR